MLSVTRTVLTQFNHADQMLRPLIYGLVALTVAQFWWLVNVAEPLAVAVLLASLLITRRLLLVRRPRSLSAAAAVSRAA